MRRSNSGLFLPDELVVPSRLITLHRGHLSDYGKRLLTEHLKDRGRAPMMGGAGTFSNWFQTAVLQHGTGQDNAAWAALTPGYLALCTVVPDSSKTGTTITEPTYTGYGRLSIANSAWAAAVAGGAGGQSTEANNGTLTFANCTAGSATIIGWAYCTALTLGNVIAWGTTSSTVISTTQTPATVATGALVLGLT